MLSRIQSSQIYYLWLKTLISKLYMQFNLDIPWRHLYFFFFSKFDILNSYIMGNWFLSQRKPECGCKEHINFSAEKEFSLYKRTSRKFSKHIEDELIERGFLSERATYLCTACADYAYENFVVPPKEKRPKHSTHYVDTIIEITLWYRSTYWK